MDKKNQVQFSKVNYMYIPYVEIVSSADFKSLKTSCKQTSQAMKILKISTFIGYGKSKKSTSVISF